jgi:hypothetical protein
MGDPQSAALLVTGIDLSTVALDRAGEQADEASKDVADWIAWRQGDLLSWDPGPGAVRLDVGAVHPPHPATTRVAAPPASRSGPPGRTAA